VNSTLACALVALKKGIAVIHVEAGLRSFGRSMPEEISCLLTDQISDLLLVTAPPTWTTPSRCGPSPAQSAT
jgi:UDP-N-acetylglucosamine 2-epimerase (non-hydrolysing)